MRLICFGENPGLAEARAQRPSTPAGCQVALVASYHDDQPTASDATLEALAETRSSGGGDKRAQQCQSCQSRSMCVAAALTASSAARSADEQLQLAAFTMMTMMQIMGDLTSGPSAGLQISDLDCWHPISEAEPWPCAMRRQLVGALTRTHCLVGPDLLGRPRTWSSSNR